MQSSTVFVDKEQNMQPETFRIKCRANADLSLAIKYGEVMLTKTNPGDDSQAR
jgi:hypothetical protein